MRNFHMLIVSAVKSVNNVCKLLGDFVPKPPSGDPTGELSSPRPLSIKPPPPMKILGTAVNFVSVDTADGGSDSLATISWLP